MSQTLQPAGQQPQQIQLQQISEKKPKQKEQYQSVSAYSRKSSQIHDSINNSKNIKMQIFKQQSKKDAIKAHQMINPEAKDNIQDNKQIQWQATYYQSQFHLQDPDRIKKLKQLQQQIEQEKIKLQNLKHVNQTKNRKQSLLSLRQDQSENQKSIKSHINNISVLERRKNHAEKDLHQQQDKYRSKIQQMKKILKQKKQKTSSKMKQMSVQKDHIKIIKNSDFKNQIKSQQVNIQQKASIFNKQLTDRVQQHKFNQGFKKQKAIINIDLQGKTKSQQKQVSKKELESHSKVQNKEYQIKINKNSFKQQFFDEPSKPSIRKSVSRSKKNSQINKEQIMTENSHKKSKINIQNQELSVRDKVSSLNSALKQDINEKIVSSKKSNISRDVNEAPNQNQIKQQLINIQKLEKSVNKSIKESEKQFSIKSSKKKEQLYQFLNQSETSKKEGSIFQKKKQSDNNDSIKRESVTVPVIVSRQNIDESNNLRINILASSKVSESKNSEKSGNRSFLIHYPKQKSQSSKKANHKQSDRYNYKKMTEEDQKKASESVDFQSKTNSLINQKKLRNSFLINHNSNKQHSIGQQIEMIPKGQLVKLRQQMHVLKKQLDLILENQQRSNFFQLNQESTQNKNKILMQSRQKSKISERKEESFHAKKSKKSQSKEEALQDRYSQLELPQVNALSFSPSRLNRRVFNIQSSIVQYDFLQEKRRQNVMEDEKQEKVRLHNQIDRLKKTIRELRIEKIKSSIEGNSSILNNSEQNYRKQNFLPIEQQNESLMQQKGQTSRFIQKMREPQEIGTITATLQQHQISKNHEKSQIFEALSGSKLSTFNRSPERAGKIVRNSPQKEKTIYSEANNPQSKRNQLAFSLNRRGSQKKYEPSGIDLKDGRNNPLPKRGSVSVKIPANPQLNTQFSNDYMQKVDQNSKQFKDFVRQSHVNQEIRNSKMQANELQKQKKGPQTINSGKNSRVQKFLKNSNSRSRDQMLDSWNEHQDEQSHDRHQDFRQTKKTLKANKTNLEDIQFQQLKQLQDLEIPQLLMPTLPQSPTFSMTQQELIALARQTYRIFGVETQKEQNSNEGYDMNYRDSTLLLKKFKNCVFFSTPLAQDVILWDYNGRFYMGGWKRGLQTDGQKSGQGIQFAPGKHIYKGQFLKGKKNGYGIVKYENGNIYQGQWSQGVKNGRGRLFQATTGVIYDGEWKDNKKDGSGVLRFSSKQYYDGTFVKSMKHGFGFQAFINGDQYKGEYSKGKFHGRGKYIWSNGAVYEGNFIEGLRSGQGIWRSSKIGSISDQYAGQYFNDKKNGYGRYIWANGCIYEGYFQNDLKNGKGRLIYDDGKQVKGTWNMGNLVNTENGKKAFQNQEQPLKKSLKYSSFMMEQPNRDTAKNFYKDSRA